MTRLGVDAALVAGELVPGDVELGSDGRIQRVAVGGAAGKGRIAVPGLIDVQVNGFAGVDLTTVDQAGLARVSQALAATGVTHFLPTLITDSVDTMVAQATTITALAAGGLVGAQIEGIHLEGPAINPTRSGAHSPDRTINPGPELAHRLRAEVPDLALVTLAPELDGALAMTRALHQGGVTVSFGHTDATQAQAAAGFEAGGRGVTHLFNAMRPLHHREPGIAAVALMNPQVFVGLIADRLHVDPTMVALAARLAPDRLVLVTDACAGAASPDGEYTLGGEPIRVTGGEARRPDDGVLAGSTLTMPEAIRTLIEVGVPWADAVGAAATTPWWFLGRTGRGSLRPGEPADLVVTDRDLTVYATLVGGRTVHQR